MWEYVTKVALNNFGERYSELSECEVELVKLLTSPFDSKVNYLKDLKNENTELINKLISESDEEEGNAILESFKSKIDKIEVDKPTELNDSIIACFQLKENLAKL